MPFSVGGTGIVIGRPTAVGITDPVQPPRRDAVRQLRDPVSWEWPRTAQLAELTWEVDDDADCITVSGRRSTGLQGGRPVPLGRGPCTVEVRAVIMADGVQFTSPPVGAVVDQVVDVAVGYTVSATAGVGPFGGRSKQVIFRSDEACDGRAGPAGGASRAG